MTIARKSSGRRGEGLAQSFLKKYGYKIIEKNYKTKAGEIDIIGKDRDCTCFVEVRSSNSLNFGLPEYTIDGRKQNQIAKAALMYIKRNGLEDKDCRFDVVCIEAVDSPSPKPKLIKNAFDLDARYKY